MWIVKIHQAKNVEWKIEIILKNDITDFYRQWTHKGRGRAFGSRIRFKFQDMFLYAEI